MRFFSVVRQYFSFPRILVSYLSVARKLIKDSVFRFKKDFMLILITGVLGGFLQVGAIAQVIYYARVLETGKTFVILGHHIEPRSAGTLFICIAGISLLLLFSSFLIYYSNRKIIRLACAYMSFCSTRVFSIIGHLRGICSPGMLSLYNNRALLKLASSDARFCGRVLRLLIKLVQPTFTFAIALGALFYINFMLTVIVLFITGVSFFFHYRNNVKGASSSRKMENHAPGASNERRKILQAAMRLNSLEENFFKWMGAYYAQGEIKQNLEGYQERFQTLEKAKLINDILMAIMLASVALILGGSAIIHNAFWGRLIIYLFALKYCLNHLKTTLVTFTSINRFYPQLSRYFNFVDFFDLTKTPKIILTRRCKVRVRSSPFQNSASSMTLKNGNILGLVGPFEFDFYNIPIYINCLLEHKQGHVVEVLRSMQVIMESGNGHLNELSLQELFCFPRDYCLATLHQDLQSLGFPDNMIMQLPDDVGRPISRGEWDHIEPEIRYSLGLLSAIHSGQQWIVVDSKVLEHLSRRILGHLLEKLQEKITLIVFSGKLDNVGTYGETTVAIIDGQNLIGLGDVRWFQSQRKNILEKMELAKKQLPPIPERGEDDDDELDDEI
jgi:ABC-type multidrug transport system fused ATPase/permease subunit